MSVLIWIGGLAVVIFPYLFTSVATTSTKPPHVIKNDIRTVLDRMQVQYRETKTGFECIHMPSIDVNSVQPDAPPRRSQHRKQGSTGSHETDTTRKSVVRKGSKISFGIKNKEREKEKEREREGKEAKEKELPSRPSGGTNLSMTPSSASSSFFHISSHANNADPARPAEAANTPTADGSSVAIAPLSPIPYELAPPRSQSPASSKLLPPIPPDSATTPQPTPLSPLPTGEVDQEVFDLISANSLAVRFEVNIVKVRCTISSHRFLITCVESIRFLGCHCMVFNSGAQVEMGGSTICWHGGS